MCVFAMIDKITIYISRIDILRQIDWQVTNIDPSREQIK